MERPGDLGVVGGGFWDAVLADEGLRLRADEFVILELACRQLQTISELRAAFNADPQYMVTGSMKQKVINPLIAEIRVASESFARHARQLGLPDDPERAAQKAAQASEYFRNLGNLSWQVRKGNG